MRLPDMNPAFIEWFERESGTPASQVIQDSVSVDGPPDRPRVTYTAVVFGENGAVAARSERRFTAETEPPPAYLFAQ